MTQSLLPFTPLSFDIVRERFILPTFTQAQIVYIGDFMLQSLNDWGVMDIDETPAMERKRAWIIYGIVRLHEKEGVVETKEEIKNEIEDNPHSRLGDSLEIELKNIDDTLTYLSAIGMITIHNDGNICYLNTEEKNEGNGDITEL